jgi:hypothetical protein
VGWTTKPACSHKLLCETVRTKIESSVGESCGEHKNLSRMTAEDVQCMGRGVTDRKSRAAVTRDNMIRRNGNCGQAPWVWS